MTLTAIVLTKNEEANIGHCLEALSFADEVLVLDSGSTDRTVMQAQQCGARALSHPLTDFASQRNFAIRQAKGEWLLFVDADERVTPGLAAEIKDLMRGTAPAAVYAIPRQTFFFGQRLRFGDARGDAPVRLFPRDRAAWTQPVHEKVVTDLPCRKLKNPILHYSTRNLAHYRQKVRDYVPLEIETMKAKGVRPGLLKAILLPPAKFFQLFFFKLGILDGVAGFQYAILSAYYTLVKYWRYYRTKGQCA